MRAPLESTVYHMVTQHHSSRPHPLIHLRHARSLGDKIQYRTDRRRDVQTHAFRQQERAEALSLLGITDKQHVRG